MGHQKRKHVVIDLCDSTPEASPKRARTPLPLLTDASNAPTIVLDQDDEQEFQLILQRIKEQEESEALAKRLQDEYSSHPGSSSCLAHTDIASADTHEDDEALARRLTAEWAEEVQPTRSVATVSGPSSASSKSILPARPNLRVMSTDHDVAPDQQVLEFRRLFTSQRTCAKCQKPVPSPRGYLAFTSETIPPPKLTHLLHAPCTSCKSNHCRGCFKLISCPTNCKGPPTCPLLTCCAESRAIAIFEVLGAFDRLILGERSTSESRAKEKLAKNTALSTTSVGPGGTGYSMGHAGYGLHYFETNIELSGYTGRGRGRGVVQSDSHSTPSRADQLAAHFEDLVSRALQTLTCLFPSPYSDSAQPYDFLPHPSIGPLISLSQLPEVLGSLLRNDSVSDWTNRLSTYYAMLALLRRMADCEVTLRRLIEPRWEVKKSCGIDEWMWGDGDIVWEQKGNGGGIMRGAPLYRHFQKLTKQSEAFLAGAMQMMGEEGDDEVEETMVKITSLCGDIIAARDDIQRTMNALGCTDDMTSVDGQCSSLPSEPELPLPNKSNPRARGKGKTKVALEKAKKVETLELDQAYAHACEHLAFKYVMLADTCDDGLAYSTFAYANELKNSANAVRNPRDRMHLVKELAVMATSLPPGIWVRADEVRNDVIKILIAGPEGTPYAGGLFEFDCFMPIRYPQVPPQMHLRTTGNGTVRFNPNLYESGKVCLSLLGTWAGSPEEQWAPYKSTLLQVLVSIQSMILIDLPWFNEPGRGAANPKNVSSTNYNRQICLYTSHWAIVGWLKDAHRHGIWADVIAAHFTLRRDRIREQIVQWAAQDGRMHAYQDTQRSRGRADYSNDASSTPIDLLEEFDKGIERIKEWNWLVYLWHDAHAQLPRYIYA